ncbi:MAG TPA: Gfo/Idh/MocA family oxidoreductase [Bryobacteraceae bacterium]|nr:Gfo/Idh/MocA family oxidoreductase [Bryobacteraceae bacterium]
MIRVGVIGYGYWGPIVARNFHSAEGSKLVAVADGSPAALARAAQAYPGILATADAMELIRSPQVDAVAVITPVWTHFEFAKAALENGKHVFVEKPFAASSAQASQLIDLAAAKGLQIMVDHTFLFTGAVRKLRQLIEEGILGKLFYYDSTRVNLGLFQHDVNVIWDLAPHDLAIMDHLIDAQPEAVSATGQCHFNGLEDLAYLTVYFPGMLAHINVNWLSPVKVRTTLIGGEKKMAVWNDVEPDEKVRVYDKGVEITTGQGVYDLLVSYRSGDMWAPRVDQTEALKREAAYFRDCIQGNRTPVNDGLAGLRVVRMLEAAGQSLKQRGGAVAL